MNPLVAMLHQGAVGYDCWMPMSCEEGVSSRENFFFILKKMFCMNSSYPVCTRASHCSKPSCCEILTAPAGRFFMEEPQNSRKILDFNVKAISQMLDKET